MVILDTDFLVALLRGNEDAINKAHEIETLNRKVSTTSITSYELFKGAYLSGNPSKNISDVIRILSSITILHFDFDASMQSAKVYFELKNKGKLTNTMDQMIAAIALSNNKKLITRNVKHYRNMHQLRIETW